MNLLPSLAALATRVPLADTTRALFGQLGYPTDRQNALEEPTWAEFEANYVEGKPRAVGFDQAKARVSEWAEVDLAFQLAQADLTDALSKDRHQLGILFEEKRSVDVRNVQSWLVFSVRLTGTAYARAELAALTREVNKLFNGPALVLMTYGPATGKQAALAVIHRRLNKQDGSRDVLEKVSLLKDINLANPNRAHLDILTDLSLVTLKSQHPSMQTFADLYRAWHQTLDTQALNNRFYRELRNWYFWAVEKVEFPSDAEPDRATRNATGVIRLITRLMFCWFLKEKGLISADVFNEAIFRGLVDPDRDPTGSAYYRAILQNLFFATLNTEMEKDFVTPADKPAEKSRLFKPATVRSIDPNRGDKTYYRYANLFRDFNKATGDAPAGVGLFRDIPHLNGGLFECLDERSGGAGAKNSISRAVDCFTADKKHYGHLSVPNELFFGEPHVEDLSANYDDKEKKKHRRDAVRGLIPLLNRYKFTVEENTPLEEEVALDPELLGRVFESLLATYNPETRQTARKQTGSFYTPREIVAYMVDESLLRYLAEKLEPTPPPRSNGRPGTTGTGAKLVQTQDRLAENLFKETKPQQASLSMVPAARAAVAEVPEVMDAPTEETATVTRLRSLLGHAPLVAAPHPEHTAGTVAVEEEPLFSAEETRTLVRALAQARILDPACGSGAYPMGTLQQLTNVLSRLDPYNHYWREALAEQVQLKVRGTFRIADEKERASQLTDLNAVFEQHTGTDYGRKLYLIQQAMYGVDLQPIAVQIAKLRFFISLVVEQVPDDTQRNRGIRALPNLETKFVAANSLMRLARPKQLVIQNPAIEPLKAQLLETRRKHFLARGSEKSRLRIEDERLRNEISRLLEHDGWHPNEAKQVAAWNPYDQNAHAAFFDSEWMFGIEASGGFDIVIGNPPYGAKLDDKALLKKLYPNTSIGNIDSYKYFIDLGLQLINSTGVLNYITSDSYLEKEYFADVRLLILLKATRIRNIKLGDDIFDEVNIPTAILIAERSPNQVVRLFGSNVANATIANKISEASSRMVEIEIKSDIDNLFMLKTGINFVQNSVGKLIDFYSQVMGIKVYQVGKGNPKQTNAEFETNAFVASQAKGESWIKFIDTGIKRYGLPKPQHFINYGPWLAEPREASYFNQPRIIIREVVNPRIFATIYTEPAVVKNTCAVIVEKEKGWTLNFLLGIINSNLFTYYVALHSPKSTNKLFPSINSTLVKNFPLVKPSRVTGKNVEVLVNQILTDKAASATADTTALEAQIDVLVYHLYGLRYAQVKLIEPGFELSEADYARQA